MNNSRDDVFSIFSNFILNICFNLWKMGIQDKRNGIFTMVYMCVYISSWIISTI